MVTPLMKARKTLVLLCFGESREARMIRDLSLLTSRTLDFHVFCRFLNPPFLGWGAARGVDGAMQETRRNVLLRWLA